MNLDDAPAPVCASCGANLWDTELAAGRHACYRCEDRAAEQLHAIRGTFKRLDSLDALIKVRAGSDGPQGGSREAPAPLRIAILNQTGPGGAVTQLQAVEDDWRKALGWGIAPTRHHADIDGVTVFLINNLPWSCEKYGEIADDLKTIANLHSTLTSLETGERGPRRFAAYCDATGCNGQLLITLWTARSTCPGCGTSYDKTGLAALRTELDPDTTSDADAA